MSWTRSLGLALALSPWMIWASASLAQSLDDQLLEGLRANPLDTELGRSLMGPLEGEELGQGTMPETTLGPRDLRERLRRDAAAPDETVPSPALEVARDMRQVQTRLSQANWDTTTQAMQAKILADLDEMIDQASRRCGKCQGSSPGDPRGQPGNKPGELEPDETSRAETATNEGTGKADTEPDGQVDDALKRVWGELPDVQRQRVLQAMGEEFLPKYRALIESYYRRLAEEMP